MKHDRIAITAAALFASVAAAAPALATPASGFTAVQQYKGVYAPMEVKAEDGAWELELKAKGTSDLHVVRNSIAAGGQSGWHRHPGPSLITVTIGEITAYDSDDPLCSPRRYTVGQGFIDYGHHAHLLRNETSAAAETVAVQFLPKDAGRRIDAPAPNNCTF